ncbi:hypothetical protein PanWU01x14_295270 [Parasponia andersonii]|uniref:Uncharacterized protein n=1 Tax=Parasponia andersonii TaxID=3476 RepID=A0A2P5AW14_PARAD|nr:hypothetical protein PanWU01x14_295270 [Parasponia andersonii]
MQIRPDQLAGHFLMQIRPDQLAGHKTGLVLPPLEILETPSLLAEGSAGVKKNIFKEKPPQSDASTSGCCSW